MSPRPFDPAAVEAEVDRIRSLGIAALRGRWRSIFGGAPPTGLTKDIIKRLIAYRIQEKAFGGLDRETKKLLDRLARGRKTRVELNRRLKPGAVLLREYQGTRHIVTVVPDGFSWQGTTYTSLSTIARTITGTAWNGPRFFGLRDGGRKQVDGSIVSSAAKLKPHRGRRPAIRPRPDSQPQGRIRHGPTIQETLPLRDLHAQVDRA
jgi:Protein of unknown function (DUF2924)